MALTSLVTSCAATSARRSAPRPIVLRERERQPVNADGVPRLHDLRPPVATALRRSRDLFGFRKNVAPPIAAAEETSTTMPVREIGSAAPPVLKLIGIASDSEADDVSHTAIITVASQLFLVQEGDSVTSRYRVSKISNNAAELCDTHDGTWLRLVLQEAEEA